MPVVSGFSGPTGWGRPVGSSGEWALGVAAVWQCAAHSFHYLPGGVVVGAALGAVELAVRGSDLPAVDVEHPQVVLGGDGEVVGLMSLITRW